MLQKILVFFLFTSFSNAATIDYEAVNGCTSNFTDCSKSNCTNFYNTSYCSGAFKSCLATAQVHTTVPLSCYQAQAAWTSIKYALIVAVPVFTTSLVIVPVLSGVFEIVSNRTECCGGKRRSNADDAPLTRIVIQTNEPIATETALPPPPIKSLTGRMLNSVSMLMTAALSCVTLGWFFTLWNSWSVAQASCAHDSDARPEG